MDISRPCQPEKLIPLLPWSGFDPSFSGHDDRRTIISEWTCRRLSHRGWLIGTVGIYIQYINSLVLIFDPVGGGGGGGGVSKLFLFVFFLISCFLRVSCYFQKKLWGWQNFIFLHVLCYFPTFLQKQFFLISCFLHGFFFWGGGDIEKCPFT